MSATQKEILRRSLGERIDAAVDLGYQRDGIIFVGVGTDDEKTDEIYIRTTHSTTRVPAWQFLAALDANLPHGGWMCVGCPCSTRENAEAHLASMRRLGDARRLIVVAF